MSNLAEKSSGSIPSELLQKHGAALDAWFDDRFAKKLKEVEENKTPSLAIIATKGTWTGISAVHSASTASALGWDVSVFFTFTGSNCSRKNSISKSAPWAIPACR
jgi:hypothetical protein